MADPEKVVAQYVCNVLWSDVFGASKSIVEMGLLRNMYFSVWFPQSVLSTASVPLLSMHSFVANARSMWVAPPVGTVPTARQARLELDLSEIEKLTVRQTHD